MLSSELGIAQPQLVFLLSKVSEKHGMEKDKQAGAELCQAQASLQLNLATMKLMSCSLVLLHFRINDNRIK